MGHCRGRENHDGFQPERQEEMFMRGGTTRSCLFVRASSYLKLKPALFGMSTRTTFFPRLLQLWNALLSFDSCFLSIPRPCLILSRQKSFDDYRFSLISPRFNAFLPRLLRVEPLAKACKRTKQSGAEIYTLPEMMHHCQEIAGTGNRCA